MADTQQAPWWAPYLTAVVVATIAAGAYVYRPAEVVGPSPSPAPGGVDLAALVPDATARGQLAGFFADFALIVSAEQSPITSTGEFRDTYRRAVPVYQAAGKLPSVQAIDEPIAQRLQASIGLEDQPLDGDPPLRGTLVRVLADIASELGA